jgi:hypothetical protein
MPDTRRHRGPHPQDAALFAPAAWPALRAATGDLSWLLTRGYAEFSALKLVGDRFQLAQRQRLAVMRAACSDQARRRRQEKQCRPGDLAGARCDIDGFNVLTTIEAALSGGLVLWARDGCYRDLASMHGTYRRVQETRLAIVMAGQSLAERAAAEAYWYLDRPVSNSGRLAAALRQIADQYQWNWTVELPDDPDQVLSRSPHIVITADSVILDRCEQWFNLARDVIAGRIPTAQAIPLGVA